MRGLVYFAGLWRQAQLRTVMPLANPDMKRILELTAELRTTKGDVKMPILFGMATALQLLVG